APRYRGQPRRALGIPGAGPVKVITDRAILEPDPDSGELVLTTLYPGVTAEAVQAGVGWRLVVRTPLARADTVTGSHPSGLKRTMGTRDLVLFNLVSVIGLRWLATSAKSGPSSLTLWVL